MHEAETRPRSPSQKNPKQAHTIKRLAGACTAYNTIGPKKQTRSSKCRLARVLCYDWPTLFYRSTCWALEEAGKGLRKDAENKMNSVFRA